MLSELKQQTPKRYSMGKKTKNDGAWLPSDITDIQLRQDLVNEVLRLV